MKLTSASTVGTIAAEHPATIRVFQAHGVDFCCGGDKTLSEVSAAHGLGLEGFLAELSEAAAAPRSPEPVVAKAAISELISHILTRYHSSLWRELPRLGGMADKVLAAHGERHPESVPEMHRLFGALRADLEPHLTEEEDVVFPALVALEMRQASGRSAGRTASPAPVEAGIALLARQHEKVGDLLRELRRVTAGYTAPQDVCNTFRGLMHGLAELERDVHEHVHLENNVLFPAVAKLRSPAPLPAI
ncbi:MAG: iron-sulfur cluster repair di-iron protein [Acidobacteriota bacterium]